MSNYQSTWRPELNQYKEVKGAFGHSLKPVGTKLARRASKHRADHSNPGGIISEYFRQKNSKVL